MLGTDFLCNMERQDPVLHGCRPRPLLHACWFRIGFATELSVKVLPRMTHSTLRTWRGHVAHQEAAAALWRAWKPTTISLSLICLIVRSYTPQSFFFQSKMTFACRGPDLPIHRDMKQQFPRRKEINQTSLGTND